MDREARTTWIKRGPHRSVALRTTGEQGHRIVKRFRASGRLRRIGDRARARNEFRILRNLHERGLGVPEPYELRHVDGGWELSCAWIPGARTVLELLRDPGALPTRAETLARRLGQLVGQLHAAGLEHGDLHSGNLLIDRQGQPWMIDFTRARLGSRPRPEVLRRDLVALASEVLEFTGPGHRRRFLAAWRAAVGRGAWRELGSSFPAELEELARVRRWKVLIEHQDRWLRASGLCDESALDERAVLVARTVPGSDEERGQVARACLGLAPGAEIPGSGGQEVLHVDESPNATDAWLTLGRAWQHGLPGLVPLALVRGSSTRALYRVPLGGAPALMDGTPAVEAGEQLRLALDERGLRLGRAPSLWRGARGEQLLGPGCELRGHE